MELAQKGQESATSAAFGTIARVAPSLRDRELRTLIAIASEFAGCGMSGELTARDLAERANLSKSNVLLAIEGLVRRGLLAVAAGHGRKPSHFRLKLFSSEKTFGPIPGPKPALAEGVCAISVVAARRATA